ncbi:uncharacterized protein LOC106665351 [Cimex lectularius]|uniref:SEFIR domain-containing protein n=1 Tax=Cimex lectularius TaxID=79782 RepID=A0A8I6RL57_CIMLE|nr:uncharacterized protein LOC106665351 [Cimex lectularius]XP_014247196.1 uncharacterized protein LOC106665351 [Cimex lectularius]XP_014247197.1 uncharacterized protein LOC106665351 [Cimex lectularius]
MLITFIFFVLASLASAIKDSASFLPQCVVQHKGGCEQPEHPCSFIQQRKISVSEMAPYKRIQHQKIKFKSGMQKFPYFNISVSFNNSVLENFDVIQNWSREMELLSTKVSQHVTLWEIQPLNIPHKYCQKPVVNVIIAFVPFQQDVNNTDDIEIIQRLGNKTFFGSNYRDLFHRDEEMWNQYEKPIPANRYNDMDNDLLPTSIKVKMPCKQNTSDWECNSFHNKSNLSFIPTYGETATIELRLLNKDIKGLLSIELLTSMCSINCVIGSSSCSNGSIDVQNFTWNHSQPKLINASKPGYYCARLFPEHRCCAISTEPIIISETAKLASAAFVPVLLTDIISKDMFFGIIRITIIICFTIVLITLLKGKNKYCPYYKISADEITDSNLLNSVHDDVRSPLSTTYIDQHTEVLLLYQRESDEFLLLMDKFRNLMSLFFQKVWDPLARNQCEEVTQNYPVWVDQILASNYVKVVIVNNGHSQHWQDVSRKEHHLDGVFTYAISALRHNPTLIHNYKRLFIVRFYLHNNNDEFLNIVPCTRYGMPDHLQQLIQDLTGVKAHQFNWGKIPPYVACQWMEEFNSALKQYKNTLAKSNHLSFPVSVEL